MSDSIDGECCASHNDTVSSERRASRRRRWWLYVVAALPILFALHVLFHGYASKTELSVRDFSRRSTQYFRIPGTEFRVPLTTIDELETGYGDLLASLGLDKAMPFDPDEVKEWHLCYTSSSNSSGRGAAARLSSILFQDRDHLYQWTKEHPELASVVWTHVLDLARSGEFDYAAILLLIRSEFRSLEEGQQMIDEILRGFAKERR